MITDYFKKISDAAIKIPDNFNVPFKMETVDCKSLLPEVSKDRTDYKDTFFSDMAEDIKSVQAETNRQLQLLIEENRKSEKFSRKIIVSTLIVSVLTLFATITGIVLQFL